MPSGAIGILLGSRKPLKIFKQRNDGQIDV